MLGHSLVVRAAIHTIGGFSAHAGQSQLIDWVSQIQGQPTVYLVHGEVQALETLQAKLQQQGMDVHIAKHGQRMAL